MSYLQQLKPYLFKSRTRQLIWIETTEQARELSLKQLLQTLGYDTSQGVLVGKDQVSNLFRVDPPQVVRLLGATYQFAVVDAFTGFNPNAVAQITGSIAGGGVLILMTPEAQSWPSFADLEYWHLGYRESELRPKGLFLRWICQGLNDKRVYRMDKPADITRSANPAVTERHCQQPFRSNDQFCAVNRMLAAWSRERSVLVMSADRGRGKSTAIGLALAMQCSFRMEQIWVCAPQRSAVDAIFSGYEQLRHGGSKPHFFLPSDLLRALTQTNTKPKLLIIDEAAGIPAPILSEITVHSAHLLLSTTVQGYEGQAGGFALRFLSRLASEVGEISRISLSKPIRWSEQDTLEPLLNDLLLMSLDAEVPAKTDPVVLNQAHMSRCELDKLIAEPALLKKVFSLLSNAHYRTSPADLRILLDAPNQYLWLAHQDNALVAVLWVARETIDQPGLAAQIRAGRRRPVGNLLPQTLLYHEGWEEASEFSYMRVVRIAVAQNYRRSGIGAQLMARLEQAAIELDTDFIGTSFSFYTDVADFWLAQGLVPIRLGELVDKVAAAPALVMLKALNSRASIWFQKAHNQFIDRLSYLEPRLNSAQKSWIKLRVKGEPKIDFERDQSLLKRFSANPTPVSLILPALARWVKSDSDTNIAKDPLVAKVLSREQLSRAELKRLRALIATESKVSE